MKQQNENTIIKEIPVPTSGIGRRDFFKLLGGGIIVFFNPFDFPELTGTLPEQARSLPKDFNAFLHIAEDGNVSCFTGKIEMGQGVITSLAQMMADELEVPYKSVKMVMGDTDLCPWDAGTFGSLTTRAFGPFMRAAAAEARTVLLQLASERLKIPLSQLEARDGLITDRKNNKNRITYAQLTKGQKIVRHLDGTPVLKNYTQISVVGKPFFREDSVLKVTGQAKYSGDIHFPGMLHARILRPPSHGARLISADISEAEKTTGVKVVREGDFIAVLSENRNLSDETLSLIKAEYSFNEMQVNDRTIFDWILKADSKANVIRTSGDLASGRQLADAIFESEYYNSYVAHSPIEPHMAVAMIDGDRVNVWASTQTPFPAKESVARALEVSPEKVRVRQIFTGGGFGGKSPHQQAVEAARLAKITGKPVMVSWTREEEFFYDTFRPAAVVRITSGIDKSGKIVLWDYHEYYAGSRGSDTIYDVLNATTTSYSRNNNAPAVHPFGTGAWRAPGNNTNTFARESQINIMAAKAGIDPLEFRLKNLKDERMAGVLRAVADKFGYVPGKTPSGRGIGIACGTDAGTWVAHMAEVKVDKNTGDIQVLRVACAQDMGLCINPQGATIQMEGCITMGLGYVLTEEIHFNGGKIEDLNFNTYKIPRFSWIPKIDTVILDMKDKPSQGGGEPAIICMGGLIANAVFDACGARLYQLPMTPGRVLEALKRDAG
jgi:isoquinoline 1-oxidoreductase